MIVPPLSSILSYTNRPPPLPSKWWQGAGYLLDGYAPYLAADFVRDRYSLLGREVLASALFTRSGGAKWVVGPAGALAEVPANALAFDYASGRRRMLLEWAATNLFVGSDAPTAAKNITVTAQSYTVSFWGTGSVVLSGAASGTLTGTGASNRVSLTVTATAGTLSVTPSAGVLRLQVEAGSIATSYIPTTSAAVTRVADVGPWSAQAVTCLSPIMATLAVRCTAVYDTNSPIVGSVPGNWVSPLGVSDKTYLYQMPPGLGSGSHLAFNIGPNIGSCHAWGDKVTVGSANGLAIQTKAYYAEPSWVPTGYKLMSSGRTELDEIIVWPIKGSNAAIQAQARVWA